LCHPLLAATLCERAGGVVYAVEPSATRRRGGRRAGRHPKVFDAAGNPITPTPSVSYQVLPTPRRQAGPVVNGNQIVVSRRYAGQFHDQGTVANSTVTADTRFTVIQNAAQSANSGLYVTLSAAQSA